MRKFAIKDDRCCCIHHPLTENERVVSEMVKKIVVAKTSKWNIMGMTSSGLNNGRSKNSTGILGLSNPGKKLASTEMLCKRFHVPHLCP